MRTPLPLSSDPAGAAQQLLPTGKGVGARHVRVHSKRPEAAVAALRACVCVCVHRAGGPGVHGVHCNAMGRPKRSR